MLFASLALFTALQTLLFGYGHSAPIAASSQPPASSTYWVADIARKGGVAFGASGYQIFRNVKDFGATGDGSTDDTAAINNAVFPNRTK